MRLSGRKSLRMWPCSCLSADAANSDAPQPQREDISRIRTRDLETPYSGPWLLPVRCVFTIHRRGVVISNTLAWIISCLHHAKGLQCRCVILFKRRCHHKTAMYIGLLARALITPSHLSNLFECSMISICCC